MRILIANSFPIPGDYDGTAMLPIKILRALKPRGVDVVVAHLRAGPPWGSTIERGEFEDTPVYTVPPAPGSAGAGLKKIAREHPFELVHAQHYGGATRASFACRRYRWPMVYEIHSLLGDEVRARPPGAGNRLPGVSSAGAKGLPARGRGDRAGRAGQKSRRRGEGRAGRSRERDLPGNRPGRVRRPGRAGDDSGRRARDTRSSCTSAASCIPTRACRS